MQKLILIGLKDLRLTFRDRTALIFILLAPFLLTMGMGFVTGRFSGGSGTGLKDIPVVIVNQDQAQLGNALKDAFHSAELTDLVEPTEASSPETARAMVDADEAAAAVIIPDGFTESIIPNMDAMQSTPFQPQTIQIEVYSNPTRPTSSGIIRAIVDEFISRVEAGRVNGITSILSIPDIQKMDDAQIKAMVDEMRKGTNQDDLEKPMIALQKQNQGAEAVAFDPLAYMAPGMALMFLMFTVSNGGRSLLAEKSQGTLPRLMISPTQPWQILGGKVLGIYLTGAAQMGILIVASALFFGVRWGDVAGLLVLVLAAVWAATGWGLLLTATARSAGQVSALGSALMLIFGVLGGSFVNLNQMGDAVQLISKITPNAWALDGFTTLALGGRLSDISSSLLGLLAMGGILFVVSTILFSRSNIMKR